ncbi:MAG TPA: sterol desaturase family protein, partial [Patescibacteria group bacterium]|nr:sterol desaturase family protein [Patescibacteria group bacterium]
WVAVDDFRWPHALTALLVLVFANLVEWCAHKELLHKRRKPFEILYDQHTPRHHMFYRHGSMAVASRTEWIFVLMPRRGVLGIAVLAIPLALVVGALVGAGHGWTAFMAAGSYASIYEVTHLCYHLPRGNWVMRVPLFGAVLRALSRHHARHHHVQLMRKWNFNVTVPLWDFILRTHYPRSKPLPEP